MCLRLLGKIRKSDNYRKWIKSKQIKVYIWPFFSKRQLTFSAEIMFWNVTYRQCSKHSHATCCTSPRTSSMSSMPSTTPLGTPLPSATPTTSEGLSTRFHILNPATCPAKPSVGSNPPPTVSCSWPSTTDPPPGISQPFLKLEPEEVRRRSL